MTGTLRVRRSRGALSGVLLVLLGIWGALIPFIGPYFHFAYTPDKAWDYTNGRMWLEVLPGAAVLVGGIFVLVSRHRLLGVLAAWLAAAGGAWFAVGGVVAAHWTSLPSAGTPVGGPARMVAEQIGYFIGLGVFAAFMAGLAMGRFTVVSARDIAVSESMAGEPLVSDELRGGEPAAGETKPVRRLSLPRPLVRTGSSSGHSPD